MVLPQATVKHTDRQTGQDRTGQDRTGQDRKKARKRERKIGTGSPL